MPVATTARTISQETFNGFVNENIEDLGMDPDEALEDAIQTLTLQGVDLSGVVKCVPGTATHPVIRALEELEKAKAGDVVDNLESVSALLDELCTLCLNGGSDGDVAIATRNGGVELICSICSSLDPRHERPLVAAFKVLASLLHDIQSSEAFRQSGGPKIVLNVLKDAAHIVNLLDGGFAVVAAAATGNEIVKESFMELRIDELIVQIMREQSKCNIQSFYDSIRVLLTPDDDRVLASQVYGYARRFYKIGIADSLVDALREGLNSAGLVSACVALKAVAVNDEICRSIADNGGIDVILQCIDDNGDLNNKAAVKACCSLLSKLAGSDANKSTIVQLGGLDKLIKLSHRFCEEPSVLQEIMSIFWVLSLRSPENAAHAVEAGVGDFAIQSMQKFPSAAQLQKQSCLMIRNLVVRNPENRTILLSSGIEKIIRKAKETHESCKDAATDALRDLGLDDYNM
ncbi:hypothetical protein QJS10_CPA06g02124 [Acorus calamus]|uniref:Armadillo repeat-containing protein 6 n=1 Tax=Acorus calamus TaxID=4465 RepID=A0AAV9EI33_ACOCL|nr:hypothetical protein QJS10_CPA06g02124 [Acorus calamus]